MLGRAASRQACGCHPAGRAVSSYAEGAALNSGRFRCRSLLASTHGKGTSGQVCGAKRAASCAACTSAGMRPERGPEPSILRSRLRAEGAEGMPGPATRAGSGLTEVTLRRSRRIRPDEDRDAQRCSRREPPRVLVFPLGWSRRRVSGTLRTRRVDAGREESWRGRWENCSTTDPSRSTSKTGY